MKTSKTPKTYRLSARSLKMLELLKAHPDHRHYTETDLIEIAISYLFESAYRPQIENQLKEQHPEWSALKRETEAINAVCEWQRTLDPLQK